MSNMNSRSLHQFSRDEVDLKRELELLRESTKQALELAWRENTEKENRIAALERQLQEMIKRESTYKHQIVELSKQVRRNTSNSRSSQNVPKPLQSNNGSIRVLESFVASPRRQAPSPSPVQKRRPSITPPFPTPPFQRRTSSSSGSVGDNILDFFGGKKLPDLEHVEQEKAQQIAQIEARKREEVHSKLESQEKLIQNLESANRKHVRTIITLQEELGKVKKELSETELSYETKLQAKRDKIAKQLKDLQRYQSYVGDLTNELEKVYGRDVSQIKTRNTPSTSTSSHFRGSRVLTAHQA